MVVYWWYETSPITTDDTDEHDQLDRLYRTTKVPRVRTRAQMILLAAAQGFKVPQLAAIVREREATVLRGLTRYLAEGLEGLQDAPRPGRLSELTEAYRMALLAAARRRPRSLGLPFSLWTLRRLVDYLAEDTRIRGSDETVRRALKQAGMVLSRPQLNPMEMLWRQFRREVTHCELLASVDARLKAAHAFFDRYHQCPEHVLSIIGAHAA